MDKNVPEKVVADVRHIHDESTVFISLFNVERCCFTNILTLEFRWQCNVSASQTSFPGRVADESTC